MFTQTTRRTPGIQQLVRFDTEAGSAYWRGPKLLLAADVIIAALIVVFPFIMGGREAWGHRILITLALALGCIWSLYKLRTGGRLILLAIEPLIVAGLLLVWLQTITLAPHAMNKVSSEYERLLPGWTATQIHSGDKTLPNAWNTASLIPTETEHAFLILLSYGVIAIVIAQRLTTEADCHRMLKLVGISGMLMAVFAVIQLATSNDLFFWFYRQPYTGTRDQLKGAFTNRNHFAQFLALSIGPLIWWMLSKRSSTQTVERQGRGLGPATTNHSRFDNVIDMKMMMMVCAVGGVVVSIMLSLSRGGMIAAAMAITLCLAGMWKSGRVGASLAMVIVAVGGISVAAIMVLGQGKIEDRIDQLASGEADQVDRSNARRAIWSADVQAARAFPWLGCGVGSHRYVYPIYMQNFVDFRGTIFSHAESSYVNLVTETGIAGLALVGMGLLFVAGRITWHLLKRKEAERVAGLAAVLASLIAGTLHAAVDFIWYVPAIVVVTIVLGVTGLRLCTGFRPELGIPFPRLAWLVMGMGCLLVMCRAQPDLAQRVEGERAWTAYRNASADLDSSLMSSADDLASDAEPDFGQVDEPDYALPELAEDTTSAIANYDEPPSESAENKRINALQTRINLLLKGIKVNPRHLDMLHELSLLSLKMFQLRQSQSDNPLSDIQIRDAAMANFKSNGDMHVWLKKAFGRNIRLLMLSDQMARRALALCPVQGEAYMILLHTSFLRDVRDAGRESLINQTMLVGGNDPYVRYFIGDCLLTEGRAGDAIEQWNFVFHSCPEYRIEVCRNIARQLPADFVLETFQPSLNELDEVLTAFQDRGRQTDIEKLLFVIADKMQLILNAPATEATTPVDRAEDFSRYVRLLLNAHQVAEAFDLAEPSEQMLRLALNCDETAYWPHHAMGLFLLKQERYAEAGKMFEWCFEQKPGDAKLEELLLKSRRSEVEKRTKIHAVSHAPQESGVNR
ncbi:MAG: O-antigen ligase family protein [Planctomycetaceae bacterium]|nr:O-antigen ligase family protein [Planctomycetaceae bacterium]